jgi:Family of unknown function (DUF6489)
MVWRFWIAIALSLSEVARPWGLVEGLETVHPMKITVDVDCTPLEARQFMGLPDVEPMQKAAMAEIERRMVAELERFSPETLFKAWLPIAGMNAEWFQEFLKRATTS